MKKIRELFPLDNRTKFIVSIAAVGAVLLAAMLLPLSFRTHGETGEEAGRSTDRLSMFAVYWDQGTEDCGLDVIRPEKVREEMKTRCETVMKTLTARCIEDHALEYTGPTGSEYTVLRSGDGTELPLCRMWIEAKGDWQNWLDVCFDAETGEVYYLYLSRECLTNRQDYSLGDALPKTQGVAESLAAEYGWTLRWLNLNESGSAAAVYDTGIGSACYQIDCRVFDALIDVKLCCR